MMPQLSVGLQRRSPVETFSQSSIDAMGDGVQLALGVTRQVGAAWEVMTERPIGVSVGAALLQAVWNAKMIQVVSCSADAHAQSSLCLDHRSACCAVGRARTGVFL